MPHQQSGYREARRPYDTAKPVLVLDSFAILSGILSFILTDVYSYGTDNIAGQVHRAGTVNASRLQYAKFTFDSLTTVVPALFIFVSMKYGHGSASSSISSILLHIFFAVTNLVMAVLTFMAYVGEGYAGLVGELPKLVARKGNTGYSGPPAGPTYMTNVATQDRMVGVWVGSGVLEALGGLCMMGAIARLLVARWRNS